LIDKRLASTVFERDDLQSINKKKIALHIIATCSRKKWAEFSISPNKTIKKTKNMKILLASHEFFNPP
jgi:hypothetical protein